MGAKQSRRSVDITTTPKKGECENAVEGEVRVEKIGDIEAKVTTNGAIHTEIEFADKEETDKEQEAVKENGVADEEEEVVAKTPSDTSALPNGEPAKSEESVTEKSGESTEKVEEATENNKKNKEKKKKKWSFRSISFSKKDKSKPNKEAEKNGEVKEVAEEGENAVSPSTEVPKAEGEKAPEAAEVVTNGEAKPEEIAKPVEASETPKPAEEPPKVEESKTVVAEKPVEQPAPVKEEPPVVVPETKVETPIEEPKPVEPVVEESKEVRNEEIPPPLPSSNPPSQVTVFAESTMADVLPIEQISSDVTQILQPPQVETVSDPVPSSNTQTEVTPPVIESAPESQTSIIESSPAQSPPAEIASTPQTSDDQVPQCPIKESQTPVVESSPVAESTQSPLPEPTPEVVACPLPEVKPAPVEEVAPVIELAPVVEPVPAPVEEISIAPSEESVPAPPSPLPELEPISCPLPETPKESLTSSPIKDDSESLPPPLPEEPVSLPNEPLSNGTDQVVNADSLPDISTESLPSLPDPISESLPEPMSLPPVDCVPEPITVDNSSLQSETASSPDPIPATQEKVPESVADIPLPPTNGEAIITNGSTNGLPPSPDANDDTLQSVNRPIKQVVPSTEALVSENSTEERHEGGDKIEIAVPAAAKAEE